MLALAFKKSYNRISQSLCKFDLSQNAGLDSQSKARAELAPAFQHCQTSAPFCQRSERSKAIVDRLSQFFEQFLFLVGFGVIKVF